MKIRRRNSKELLSSLFAFLLTLFFVILFILFGLSMGVFNSRSITKSINDCDYFGKVYIDVNQRIKEILSQAGLPDEILSDIITPARVHAAGMNYIEAVTGKEQQPSTHKAVLQQNFHMLHEDIEESIREYIEQEGIWQSELISKDVTAVADAIEYEYRSKVQLTFVEYLMSYKEDYSVIKTIMIPSLILLSGILCYLLIRVHRYGYRGMRYIAYALVASSILMLAVVLYFIFTKVYDNIKIIPEYYQQFISGYLKLNTTVFAYIGMIGLVLAMVLIALIVHMRSKILNN